MYINDAGTVLYTVTAGDDVTDMDWRRDISREMNKYMAYRIHGHDGLC